MAPALTFDALYKAARKGELPPTIYLHGEEEVLKEDFLAMVVNAVVDPGVRDFNYDQRSAAQLDADDVEALCTTLPMMSDRRLVVIRDVEAWGKKARAKAAVLRYLARPAAETVLVLVQGAPRGEEKDTRDPELAKLATAVEAERLPPARAEKWLSTKAAERGVTLEPEAIAHLVRAVDGDLAAARTELDKLAGLEAAGPIGVEQVASLLGVRRGETQGDWVDAVLHDETGRAAAMLPHVLSTTGVSGVGLVTQLGTQLAGLGLARAQLDRGLRGGALGKALFDALLRARPARLDYRAAAERWSRLAEAWPLPRVRAAMDAALAADKRLKTTALSDERGILLDLVLALAPRAEALR